MLQNVSVCSLSLKPCVSEGLQIGGRQVAKLLLYCVCAQVVFGQGAWSVSQFLCSRKLRSLRVLPKEMCPRCQERDLCPCLSPGTFSGLDQLAGAVLLL